MRTINLFYIIILFTPTAVLSNEFVLANSAGVTLGCEVVLTFDHEGVKSQQNINAELKESHAVKVPIIQAGNLEDLDIKCIDEIGKDTYHARVEPESPFFYIDELHKSVTPYLGFSGEEYYVIINSEADECNDPSLRLKYVFSSASGIYYRSTSYVNTIKDPED